MYQRRNIAGFISSKISISDPYREGNWGPEDTGDLPEATQEAGEHASVSTSMVVARSLCRGLLLRLQYYTPELRHPPPLGILPQIHTREIQSTQGRTVGRAGHGHALSRSPPHF